MAVITLMAPVSPPAKRQKQKQKQPQQVRFVVVVVVSLFLTCLCLLILPPQPKDNSKPTSALVTAAAKSYRKTAKRRATISRSLRGREKILLLLHTACEFFLFFFLHFFSSFSCCCCSLPTLAVSFLLKEPNPESRTTNWKNNRASTVWSSLSSVLPHYGPNYTLLREKLEELSVSVTKLQRLASSTSFNTTNELSHSQPWTNHITSACSRPSTRRATPPKLAVRRSACTPSCTPSLASPLSCPQ